MAIRVRSWLSRPGAVRALIGQLRLVVRLLREPRVPTLLKLIPLFAALYVVSPVDAIPDLLPGLGQLDDLTVIVLAVELFVWLCPTGAQAFHREAIARRGRYTPMPSQDEVIDAEWRRL